MRALFIVWAVVIGQIAAWTYFAPAAPAPQTSPPPLTPSNDDKGFGSNEANLLPARASERKAALHALGKPWSSFCTEGGRKSFISGLGYYYYHRQNQSERYPENFGKAGADYIAQQWATTD